MSSTVNPGMTMDQLLSRVVELEAKVKVIIGDEDTGEKGLIDTLRDEVDGKLADITSGTDDSLEDVAAKLKNLSSAHNDLQDSVFKNSKVFADAITSIKNTGAQVKQGMKTVTWTNKTVSKDKVRQLTKTITKFRPSDGWVCTGLNFVTTGNKHVHLVRASCIASSDKKSFSLVVRLALRDSSHASVKVKKVKVRARFINVKKLSGAQIDTLEYDAVGEDGIDIDGDGDED